MRWARSLSISLVIFMCLSLPPGAATFGQTAASGAVVGTVTDAAGAVVSGAAVELLSPATNLKLTARTNSDGQYVFPNVPPGEYTLTVTAQGFRQSVLKARAEVAKSTRGDFRLEVGDLTQQVEVAAGAQAELQTLDATVGEVMRSEDFVRLPTVQRRASELIYLQVATTPISGAGFYGGGAVAGGRTDQNTATLDGIVITDLVLGGELSGSVSQFHLPVDAISEFRGSVSNPSETQAGSGGGRSPSAAPAARMIGTAAPTGTIRMTTSTRTAGRGTGSGSATPSSRITASASNSERPSSRTGSGSSPSTKGGVSRRGPTPRGSGSARVCGGAS
jgi:Carboxypeptidase regulatory-like domain